MTLNAGVLVFLIVTLVGSVLSAVIIPPFLFKIDRLGRVNFFGIRFP